MKKEIPFFVLIIFFLSLINALSQNNEINIISNKLNIDMNERRSIFTGNVYAQNHQYEIWSDKIIIDLKKDKDEIKEFSASGNVKILRLIEGTEIYGDMAKYSLEQENMVITGNVIVLENGNKVTGNKLTVDLKNSSSIMTGSELNREEALIIEN